MELLESLIVPVLLLQSNKYIELREYRIELGKKIVSYRAKTLYRCSPSGYTTGSMSTPKSAVSHESGIAMNSLGKESGNFERKYKRTSASI